MKQYRRCCELYTYTVAKILPVYDAVCFTRPDRTASQSFLRRQRAKLKIRKDSFGGGSGEHFRQQRRQTGAFTGAHDQSRTRWQSIRIVMFLFSLAPLRCTCADIRARNRTAACGRVARGVSPGRTSCRDTVGRTRASSRTVATCATNGSRGPTTWPNTREYTASAWPQRDRNGLLLLLLGRARSRTPPAAAFRSGRERVRQTGDLINALHPRLSLQIYNSINNAVGNFNWCVLQADALRVDNM